MHFQITLTVEISFGGADRRVASVKVKLKRRQEGFSEYRICEGVAGDAVVRR